MQNSAPYPIRVTVTNADDEPPVFESNNTFTVAENDPSKVDQVVFTVVADNTDQVDPDSTIVYGLSGGSVGDVFEIDSTTGEVTLLRVLDREAPGESTFLLLATATETSNDLTSVQEIEVVVEDKNDHAPSFEDSTLRGFVDENSPVDTVVMQVVAGDEDLAGPPLNFGTIERYERVGGTCGDLFDVQSTGEIVVATNSLNREALAFPL